MGVGGGGSGRRAAAAGAGGGGRLRLLIGTRRQQMLHREQPPNAAEAAQHIGSHTPPPGRGRPCGLPRAPPCPSTHRASTQDPAAAARRVPEDTHQGQPFERSGCCFGRHLGWLRRAGAVAGWGGSVPRRHQRAKGSEAGAGTAAARACPRRGSLPASPGFLPEFQAVGLLLHNCTYAPECSSCQNAQGSGLQVGVVFGCRVPPQVGGTLAHTSGTNA